MKSKIYLALISILFLIIVYPSANAQDPTQSLINVGNITSWVSEEGFHDWVFKHGWNGAYPNGIPIGVIFSEGIVWGGLVNDGQSPIVRVNGNTYGTGCSPITRLYRVRTDYYKADLTRDAASFFNKFLGQVTEEDIQKLKDQYENDWDEWPAERGAPYYDIDKDGRYNPDVDVPGVPEVDLAGVPGAVQTIWINYNDSLSLSNYGSPPIGLEIQETYWVYTNKEPLRNIIYKKVDIIYKGTSLSSANSKIDSMYICQWSDPDVGSLTDDYVGCDTTLNLGYAYNSSDTDAVYDLLGLAPPAVGYDFLQGVSKFTGNPIDSAIFNLQWRKGYKYINRKPMSSFVYFTDGGSWSVPSLGYNGTLEFYNLMRGYLPIPRYPNSDPFPTSVSDVTPDGTYLLPGDPVSGTGKIDGIYEGPSDRKIMVINGPISLNLGDTAEVVIALVGGMENYYLSSITTLKYNALAANLFYHYFVEKMTSERIKVPPAGLIPDNYVLYQNYPNPFNAATTIKYELPDLAYVTLVVYDILGREVSRLVDEEQAAGKYRVNFNADNLSSGIYFYRITFNNSTNKHLLEKLTKTMKLILLK